LSELVDDPYNLALFGVFIVLSTTGFGILFKVRDLSLRIERQFWPRLSPLGPWVNAAAGLSDMPLRRFTPWEVAGETVWVTLYVGAGYSAAGSIEAAQATIGNALAAVAAGAGAAVSGWWLWRAAARR